jgi:archaetidylinositol phosphate synthase
MKTKTQTRLENILLPIAKKINVNPNLLTLLSLLFTLGSAYYILTSELAIAAVLFLVGAVLDALDGLVAREHNRATKFGAFFDQFADRLNDGVIIIAVMLGGYIGAFIGIVTLFLVILASYMSAVMDSLTGKRIGEAISFRPLRSGAIFLGLSFGYIEVAMWAVLFIATWAVVYRFFKAKWLL